MRLSKRGNREGSIYRRKSDGRWAAALTLPTGGRKQVYGKTRAEVVQKMTAASRTLAQGMPIAPERETVAQYLARWLRDVAAPGVRPTTLDGYERVIRLHIVPEIGRTRLAKLSPPDLSRLYQSLTAKGLSARYVQLAHAILHTSLKQAERWSLIPRNPADLVDAPRVVRSKVQPLDATQVAKLLESARGERFEALYVLAVTSGLRQGELLGLRWADVDFDGARLMVQQQVQRTRSGWVFSEPKTAAGRRNVVLPLMALEALRGHRTRQLAEQLKMGPAWQHSDLVFANQVGAPVEKQNLVRRSFKPLLEAAGLPSIRFHDLRHTAATLLLLQGVHPKVVQERLGHANIAITMDIYSHVLPTLQQDAADRLDAFFAAV